MTLGLIQAAVGRGALAGALQAILKAAQLSQALIGAAALQLAAGFEVVMQIRKAEASQGLGFLLQGTRAAVIGPHWGHGKGRKAQQGRQGEGSETRHGESVGDPFSLRAAGQPDVTNPAATCDQISLLLLAAAGQPEALGQGLLLLGLLRARLLSCVGEGLPAAFHRRGAGGLAEAGLRLIQLLQPLGTAGFLDAALPLEILRALGGGQAAEGIHEGAATAGAFLGLAETGTSPQQEHTSQGKGGAGAKDLTGHERH